mmetsp:Transcript_43081/g.136984  ORF Transcript_43081/g.136984 Transcript_43081/m.136984 type:complete len:259 (+) Transcript_43081:1698-2474(+)
MLPQCLRSRPPDVRVAVPQERCEQLGLLPGTTPTKLAQQLCSGATNSTRAVACQAADVRHYGRACCKQALLYDRDQIAVPLLQALAMQPLLTSNAARVRSLDLVVHLHQGTEPRRLHCEVHSPIAAGARLDGPADGLLIAVDGCLGVAATRFATADRHCTLLREGVLEAILVRVDYRLHHSDWDSNLQSGEHLVDAPHSCVDVAEKRDEANHHVCLLEDSGEGAYRGIWPQLLLNRQLRHVLWLIDCCGADPIGPPLV